MAQIFMPRQRKDKRWDFTVGNDGRWTHPIGYCAGWEEKTLDELKELWGPLARSLFEEQEKRRPSKDKYHSNGHDSAESAAACYQDFLFTEHLELHEPPPSPEALHKCAVCGACTAGLARIHGGYWRDYFCDAHRTREHVREFARSCSNVW